MRLVELVKGLTRLLWVVGEARVLGNRERWSGSIDLRGVFGSSLASTRLRDPCALLWEAWEARGEGIEFGRVDGAMMLRDDE